MNTEKKIYLCITHVTWALANRLCKLCIDVCVCVTQSQRQSEKDTSTHTVFKWVKRIKFFAKAFMMCVNARKGQNHRNGQRKRTPIHINQNVCH